MSWPHLSYGHHISFCLPPSIIEQKKCDSNRGKGQTQPLGLALIQHDQCLCKCSKFENRHTKKRKRHEDTGKTEVGPGTIITFRRNHPGYTVVLWLTASRLWDNILLMDSLIGEHLVTTSSQGKLPNTASLSIDIIKSAKGHRDVLFRVLQRMEFV